ncbi:MAG: lipoyl(octanoyl) transferase LipB [Gammaproteobacteria bacterium]|nr:lipoyl(octanoyl) transferase LipB [Gammaproteobacteria bacterium]
MKPSPPRGASSGPLIVRRFGVVDYVAAWRAMREFTDARQSDARDELWFLQHYPVFTLGQAGRREHLLSPGAVPVVESDRGGQVTFHAPGQCVVYLLYDLKRARLGVRRLVERIEQAIMDLLQCAGMQGSRRSGAPGVYVQGRKIAALGLRVRSGCSYHGLALNVDPDLEPFGRIEPCGIRGLEVTSLKDLGVGWTVADTEDRLIPILAAHLGYCVDAVVQHRGEFPTSAYGAASAGLR